MTEPTDIDALRDRARESGLSLPALDYINALEAELRNVSEIGDGDVQRLAESYSENLRLEAELREAEGREAVYRIERDHFSQAAEDIKAELRQERERADEYKLIAASRVDAWRLTDANKDLARAREVIEKVRGWAYEPSLKRAGIREILSDYDQQT